jgi:hypothetical protein
MVFASLRLASLRSDSKARLLGTGKGSALLLLIRNRVRLPASDVIFPHRDILTAISSEIPQIGKIAQGTTKRVRSRRNDEKRARTMERCTILSSFKFSIFRK